MRLSVLIVALGHASMAFATPPMVTGDITRPEYVDATFLAKTMFQSTAPTLYAPLLIPQDMRSRLILGATSLGISGGIEACIGLARLERESGVLS